MTHVVLLRGVNVGGKKKFRPSALATSLADLDVASIGAAGTFVVRGRIGAKTLRERVLRELPFEAEAMICPARDVVALAEDNPFANRAVGADVKRYVSVLARPKKATRSLPILQPAGDEWQVKVIAVRGRFVLSLHRRAGRRLIYPNEVVEKSFGIPATTRNWNTISAICAKVEGD